VDTSSRFTLQTVYTWGAQKALFVGEGGGLFLTSDGGVTFTQLGTAITRAHLFSVTAISESIAWYFGERTALATSDGGITWTPNKAASLDMHSGHAVSYSRLIGGGTQGQVYVSINAGDTWTTQVLPTLGQIEQFTFVDLMNGWLAGNHGTVAKTSDGGTTWTYTNPGTTDDFHAVAAVSPNEVWVVGNGGKILHSTDGGGTWQPQSIGTTSNLHTVQFLSPTEGWVGGQLVLYKTSDGGQTWTPKTIPGLDVVYGIRFSNSSEGVILMSRGVARTKNGGQTFYRTDYPSAGLRDVRIAATGNAWLAGDFGVMQRYTPAPAILITPGLVDFGDVPINRKKELDITIANAGERPMTITNVAALGTGFSVVNVAGTSLAPDQSTTATLRFAPVDTGFVRGLVTVVSNAAIGLPFNILQGRGVPPLPSALIHRPAVLDFGKIKLGTIKAKEVVLENRSPSGLLISAQRISGNDSMYQIGRESAYYFPPGYIDSVQVVFGPQRPGVFASSLIMASNDPGEPNYAVPLTGEAINPKAEITPSPLDFARVAKDSTKTRALVIRNAGTDNLVIARMELRGANASEFSVDTPSSSPIVPGDSIVLSARCSPKTLGLKSAEVQFETTDIMNPGSLVQLLANCVLDVEKIDGAAEVFSLGAAYPNPALRSEGGLIAIPFSLPHAADVQIEILDLLGRRAGTLAASRYEAGRYLATYPVDRLAQGTYVIRFGASDGASGRYTAKARLVVLE
jgi:photosystem II stability/assembly factor-like uncharacterized protein